MADHIRLRRALGSIAALHNALWLIEDYKLRKQIIAQVVAAQPECIFCGADTKGNPMSDVDSLFCSAHCIICSGIDSVMEDVYGLSDPEVRHQVSDEVAETLRQLAERLSR